MLVLSVMAISMTNFAFAEGDVAGEESENEVEVMHSESGANMRFLQLAEAIVLRVSWMEETVEFLETKDDVSEDSINDLKGMIEELELLADDAESYKVISLEESVDKFTQIKTDARAIVTEFRALAKTFLTEEDRALLGQRFGEARAELVRFREGIRQERMEYNAERVQEFLDKMGVEDDGLVEQVRAGEITIEKAKVKLREHYASVREEKKSEFKSIRAEVNERANSIRARAESASQEIASTASERVQERAARLQTASVEFARERAERIRSNLNV